MADKGKEDPTKLPKINSGEVGFDYDANGGASASHLDLPASVRGLPPSRIKRDTQPTPISQKPSEQ